VETASVAAEPTGVEASTTTTSVVVDFSPLVPMTVRVRREVVIVVP